MARESDDSPRRMCYGCGDLNPEGLGIDFDVEGKIVTGRFTARKEHLGFPGVVHGGVAAAVMDEAMGWAMRASGAWAMTARMEVKYRRPLPLGEEVIVIAEVVRDRGKRLEAKSEIRTQSGERITQSTGVFIRVPEEVAREYDLVLIPDEQPAPS